MFPILFKAACNFLCRRSAVSVPDLRQSPSSRGAKKALDLRSGALSRLSHLLEVHVARVRCVLAEWNCHKSCIRPMDMRRMGSDSTAYPEHRPIHKKRRCSPAEDLDAGYWIRCCIADDGRNRANSLLSGDLDTLRQFAVIPSTRRLQALGSRVGRNNTIVSKSWERWGAEEIDWRPHELATDKGLTYCQTSLCG